MASNLRAMAAEMPNFWIWDGLKPIISTGLGVPAIFGVITNVPGFDQPYLTWIMKNPTSTRGNDFPTSFFI